MTRVNPEHPSDPAPSITLEGVRGASARAAALKTRTDLYEDAALASLKSRALCYLTSGAPVHFRGQAGTGKTTMALQIAAEFGRPVVMLTGDARHTSESLVGREAGTRTKRIQDRFIHNVRKTETETHHVWRDSVLTTAVSQGYTLVYDEFTRSPAEANNPLLSALEERVLTLTTTERDKHYIDAHPDFRAIFTSNPSDYAGVAASSDALVDRMITFDLSWMEQSTEAGITATRSGLSADLATPVVGLVRAMRADKHWSAPPSLRTAIMIARIVASEDLTPSVDDPRFVQLCMDVLASKTTLPRAEFTAQLSIALRAHCPARPTASTPTTPPYPAPGCAPDQGLAPVLEETGS